VHRENEPQITRRQALSANALQFKNDFLVRIVIRAAHYSYEPKKFRRGIHDGRKWIDQETWDQRSNKGRINYHNIMSGSYQAGVKI